MDEKLNIDSQLTGLPVGKDGDTFVYHDGKIFIKGGTIHDNIVHAMMETMVPDASFRVFGNVYLPSNEIHRNEAPKNHSLNMNGVHTEPQGVIRVTNPETKELLFSLNEKGEVKANWQAIAKAKNEFSTTENKPFYVLIAAALWYARNT